MSQPAITEPTTGRDRATEVGELIVFHGGEWTEEDYEALPEGVRAELHDARLIFVPSPEPRHQLAGGELFVRFRQIIGRRHLVLQEVDVRMADGRRYRTPDLIVLREWHDRRPLPPDKILLVGEIVSPTGGDEYNVKPAAYQDADIEWYLILNPTPGGYEAELFHLEDGAYVVAAKAGAGEVLPLPEPFDATIDLRTLSP